MLFRRAPDFVCSTLTKCCKSRTRQDAFKRSSKRRGQVAPDQERPTGPDPKQSLARIGSGSCSKAILLVVSNHLLKKVRVTQKATAVAFPYLLLIVVMEFLFPLVPAIVGTHKNREDNLIYFYNSYNSLIAPALFFQVAELAKQTTKSYRFLRASLSNRWSRVYSWRPEHSSRSRPLSPQLESSHKRLIRSAESLFEA